MLSRTLSRVERASIIVLENVLFTASRFFFFLRSLSFHFGIKLEVKNISCNSNAEKMVLYFYEFIMHNKIRWATLAGLKKNHRENFFLLHDRKRKVLEENGKNKRESKKLIYVFVENPLIFFF